MILGIGLVINQGSIRDGEAFDQCARQTVFLYQVILYAALPPFVCTPFKRDHIAGLEGSLQPCRTSDGTRRAEVIALILVVDLIAVFAAFIVLIVGERGAGYTLIEAKVAAIDDRRTCVLTGVNLGS